MRRVGHRDGWLQHLRAFCEILIFALFFVTFIAQPFRIPSESMTPTLQVGDFLLGDKQAYAPAGPMDKMLAPMTIRRGDMVIFHYPVDPARDLVKRVVGLPGERIHLHDGRVYVNGTALQEPYAMYTPSEPDSYRDDFPSLRHTDPDADPLWWAQLRRTVVNHEVVVPADSYFVLGDNRNDSEDSRYWGFVPRTAIVARPLLVYFSIAAPQERPRTEGFWKRVEGNLKVELGSLRVLR